ncbi:Orotidine 5'-phosphate decarboxylase [bioreactor metagenome]|uniref:Orotidine 5'-phosphate decarboxylase n=1 Tax=bioreactor metagenome TaxID=1076179 RepID=A0A644WMT9_9ZZZZ
MNRQELTDLVFRKKSVLCVGLDSELAKIPGHIREGRTDEDAVFEFNKAIVDATIQYTVAYKPNLAFYEAMGLAGWNALYRTVAYIRLLEEPVFIIADAKRADIGNTSRLYASAFFGDGKTSPDFDAVTVAPYMGSDSVSPFLSFEGKWVILLALTSNPGADDFQLTQTPDGMQLFERVLTQSKQWGNENNMMYVIGATRAEMLKKVRTIVPDNFLLIPGVGAQGGDLGEVLKNGWNNSGGLLINASRSIIFASSGNDFAEAAATEAARMQTEMAEFINKQ